ncbi:TatD family hydrolase [Mycoplasmopsis felis]|nr:TatD family hydrolase [Mycoplasmopsis felis]UWV84108.1 TatD family hydrolase [Mycoplasmopsis felis]
MLYTFAGNTEWAQKFLEFKNLYFSFSGVITFGSSQNTRDVIKLIPLERILTETDSPYLRPHPYIDEINGSQHSCLCFLLSSRIKKCWNG